jgi:hypothetical protein
MAGALALLVLLAVGPLAQEFEPARALPEDDPRLFEFEAGGYSYRVAATGNGRGTKGKGRPRLFNLRLEGRDSITRLLFSGYGDDLLLLCEVWDGEKGGAFVARLEQPSMRALWKLAVLTPSVGPTLREGRRLYLTGRGFVALLDLDTGQYEWHHEDLYESEGPGTFGAFERPVVERGDVLFRDRPVYNGPARTIVVNRKTGHIVRVE